jgi:hypothetical protein
LVNIFNSGLNPYSEQLSHYGRGRGFFRLPYRVQP